MTALGAVFFVGILAMVTDAGWMYYNKTKLQTAVNAGWKAGYDKMHQMMVNSPAGLDTGSQEVVKARVREVMKTNGYTQAQMSDVQINFGPQIGGLEVTSTQNVGLFFANVMNFSNVDIGAMRSTAEQVGSNAATIIPLAIPHGVVKDLSHTTYSVDFFGATQQFATNSEYLLKLGSGNASNASGPADDPNMKKILVPMDAGAQSDAGFLKAYGVAFWCLKIDTADVGYTPVEWLLGYRGGSFFLPYDDAVISKLEAMYVNYDIILGSTNIQAIYDQVNPNVLELINRPRVAVYSSQDSADPVEVVLQAAEIPYGTYRPGRNDTYVAGSNTRFYDGDALSGTLDDYNWVHCHHEDFTGWTGGCAYLDKSCKTWYSSPGGITITSKTNNKLCDYCRKYYWGYYAATGVWGTSAASWGNGDDNTRTKNVTVSGMSRPFTWNKTSCANWALRCAERATWDGLLYRNILTTKICSQGDDERPQCRSFKTSWDLATARGYTTDWTGYDRNRKWVNASNNLVTSNGSVTLPNDSGFILCPNRVQRMKWDVVKKLRDHVEAGGFLFAQCFAPETLDMALWHNRVFLDQRTGNQATNGQAYADCFAFSGFVNKGFCNYSGDQYYSSINKTNSGAFTTTYPLDPRCQNHTGASPNCGGGHTDSFTKTVLKNDTTVLGSLTSYSSTAAEYIKGTVGAGEFCFMGGHSHNNVQTKRLVCNNILLGSLSTKVVSGGGDDPTTGKQKNNYGCVDPDNVTAGGANDYRDRFMYGFSGPLDLSDRITPEAGNMADPTNQAVAYHVDPTTLAGRRVIVPITDVPPETGTNNPLNVDAQAIYDLQGQDHPNGVYTPDQYNFGSSVRIIGFAEFEILDPSEYTRTGSAISDGDAGSIGNYQGGQVRGRFIKYIVKPGDIAVY